MYRQGLGWVVVLSENKAISASKLKLSWVEAELGKKCWGQKILGPKNYFVYQFDKKIYFHNNLSQTNLGPD